MGRYRIAFNTRSDKILQVSVMAIIAMFACFQSVAITLKQQEEAIKSGAKFQGRVNDEFLKLLGRSATLAEKQHFGALLALKDIDKNGLDDLLMGSPEYQLQLRKDRREKFAIACLESMGGNFNFGQIEMRHEEIENFAIQCADRMIQKLDNTPSLAPTNNAPFPQGRETP